MIVLALVAGVCVGLVRGSGDQAQLTAYEPLIGRQVVLSGTVKDDADVAAGGGLRLQIIDVVLGERSLPGQIWVTIAKPGNIKRGDRLRPVSYTHLSRYAVGYGFQAVRPRRAAFAERSPRTAHRQRHC